MQREKTWVSIKDIIKKSNDKYQIKIARNNTPPVAVDVAAVAIGRNLKDAIMALKIDIGEPFPGALRDIQASYTYQTIINEMTGDSREILYSIEISPSVLTAVKSYAKSGISLPSSGLVPTFIKESPPIRLDDFVWLKGPITNVTDGDTFQILVKSIGSTEISIGNSIVSIGDSAKIRMTGINTLETQKSEYGAEYALDKNTRWLAEHSYPKNDENILKTYKMAEEAKNIISAYIANGDEVLVLVDFKEDQYGNGHGIDDYGRILGIVYAGDIHLNKSMIATKSSVFPNETLAEPYYHTLDNGEVASDFSYNTWWEVSPVLKAEWEASQELKTADGLASIKDSFLSEFDLVLDKDGFLVYNNGVEISISTYLSNSNEIPADSELEDYINHPNDDRDDLDGISGISVDARLALYEAGFTRIGDCRLMVPPVNIKVNSMSASRQHPTLRSKSSIQTQTGHSIKTIEMTVFFNGQEMINGEEMESPIPGEDKWYRNGLRPLLAQFKAAPFLPIENSMLNEGFGIYSVAFKDMQIRTVEGYPQTLQATIHFHEFNHESYMPTEEYFAGTINWRMFRWYYQRFLQPSNAIKGRTYLSKMKMCDQNVGFYIPDEIVLAQRHEAIKEFQYKLTPDSFVRANTTDESTGGQKIKDAEAMNKAKNQEAIFRQWLSGHRKEYYPKMYNMAGIFDPRGWEEMTYQEKVRYASVYREIIETMYNTSTLSSRRNEATGFTENLLGNTEDGMMYFIPNHLKEMVDVINETESYLGGLKFFINNNRMVASATSPASMVIPKAATSFSQAGGLYVIELKSVENRTNAYYRDGSLSVFDPIRSVAAIERVIDGGDAVKRSFDYYEYEFEELKATASMMESDIPLVPFPIDGMSIESISATLSKYYALLQTQSSESPTLQYLGSQDMGVSLKIAALSKGTVSRFQALMRTTQRLARDYRIAITSGTLSLSNTMLGMLGARDFLIQTIDVSSTPGVPDLFDVTINLTAFDKTQRLKEDLDSASIGSFLDYSTDEELMEKIDNYFDARKENQAFETGVLDVKLRSLEVYPDLELPTYKELNHALKYLGIVDSSGNPFTKFLNPGNGKYLDPDFYIRAIDTRRDNIARMLKNDRPEIYTVDNYGFQSIEFGPGPDDDIMTQPNVWFSDETVQWVAEELGEVATGMSSLSTVDLMGTYSEFNKKILSDANIDDISSLYGEDYSSNLNSAKNAGLKSINNAISYKYTDNAALFASSEIMELMDKDIIEWYGIVESQGFSQKVNAAKNGLKNPTSAEVHTYLYQLVKEYWPSLMDDYYQGDEIIEGNLHVSTYLYGKSRISAPEITIEKILNTLKAIAHIESGWTQLLYGKDTVVPMINMDNGNMGLMGISINSGVFKNGSEIKRGAWDWKYNARKAVEYFAWCYNMAIVDSNEDARNNPLDWAVLFYCQGLRSKEISLGSRISSLEADPYYSKFRAVFNGKYGVDATWFFATPQGIINSGLATTEQNRALIERTSDTFLDIEKRMIAESSKEDSLSEQLRKLTDIHVYPVKGDPVAAQVRVLYVDVIEKRIDRITSAETTISSGTIPIKVIDAHRQIDKGLENLDWFKSRLGFKPYYGYSVLDTVIRRKLEKMFNKDSKEYDPFDEKSNYVVIKDTAWEEVSTAYNTVSGNGVDPSSYVSWDRVFTVMDISDDKAVDQVAEDMRETSAESLILHAADDIASMYKSGYSDLLTYDHRGRLLRAFPTFQIFLVDEGRWMTWHKLWDKFYGYNAILSIDVMKDRRIVADTAVIEMSNIYHGLTTHDNSVSYGDWEIKVTDLIMGTPQERAHTWSALWNLPDAEIIRAHREELNSLILKPGARLHLRMGYGANAYLLPVVFNGTITEMNTGEIVTVVAQGDGIELTNKMSADPDETTDGGLIEGTKEPRTMICEMLTSKGGYFKNFANYISKGIFYNPNPLGIAHFGNEILPAALLVPNLVASSYDYGEAGINVYCGAGYNTFSQWIYTEGTKKGEKIGMNWSGIPWSKGDEPNVKIYLYDKTPSDIIQIYSAVCPDYVSSVLPFEFRSTLFFGKPWWGVIDKYHYQYRWDEYTNMFVKEPISAARKSLSQFRIYSSYEDIIKNDIKATDMHMYTNVMAVYDEGGKKTKLVQADSDIYTEKQTTAIVDVPIKADGVTNFWTQEKYALAAATSALSNYMREMYQGELTVLGDPAVKPHDTMYIADSFNEMSGNAWVKRVVHHFSFDTGFVTNITPDCVSIIDDRQAISIHEWFSGTALNVVALLAGAKLGTLAAKNSLGIIIADKLRKFGKAGRDWIISDIILEGIEDPESKAVWKKTIDSRKSKEAMAQIFDSMTDPEVRKKLIKMGAIGNEADELIDIMKKLDIKLPASILSGSRKTAKQLANVFAIFAGYVEEPGKIATDVDKIIGSLKNLSSKEIELLRSKGIIKAAVKNADGVVEMSLGKRILVGPAKLTGKGAIGVTKFAGVNSARFVKGALALMKSPVARFVIGNVVAEMAFTVAADGIIETWQRYLKNRQAVMVMPLKYRGKEFTAGINGHRGMVYGDSPGKMDKFLEGSGIFGDFMTFVNGIAGVKVDYSTSEYDKEFIE